MSLLTQLSISMAWLSATAATSTRRIWCSRKHCSSCWNVAIPSTWTPKLQRITSAGTSHRRRFLIDACSTIFFNTQPQFDVYEMKIPLPADDAAWEARTAEDCASALGLRGQAAQIKNVSGSRRAKQLGLAEALQVLYGPGHSKFPERATNVFGKFSRSLPKPIFRLEANLLPSTHTCDSCSDIQHSASTSSTRFNEWDKHTS
jgi:hypothetical protein